MKPKLNKPISVLVLSLSCLLALSMVLMAGCGSSDPKPNAQSQSGVAEDASSESGAAESTADQPSKEESSSSLGEYTLVDPSTVQPAAESDFEFTVEDGKATITAYVGLSNPQVNGIVILRARSFIQCDDDAMIPPFPAE